MIRGAVGSAARAGMLQVALLVAGSTGSGLMTGCGSTPASPDCTLISVMNPASAQADHAATPPGNSVQFYVGYALATPGSSCAVTQVVYLPTMISSDNVNVALPSPGVATCLAATTVPVTLTDTRSKATATLTCK